MVSGKRKPSEGEYHVQFRNGFTDEQCAYGPNVGVWLHDGGPWDIIAVKKLSK